MVERVVDLTGARASGLTGARGDEIVAATARCDVAALARTGGHFAATGRDGRTIRLARTIGIPLRYFVAKMYHGPILVVADRIDTIFAWCQAQRIGWQFDPFYTRMVPAHHLVELDQVGCPDPVPRHHRFFAPVAEQGSADPTEAGVAYIEAAHAAVRNFIAGVPAGDRIGVAFSGGVDSTAVLLLARQACRELGRSVDDVRAFTLDLGGGADAMQARATVRALALEDAWERIDVAPDDYDLEEAIAAIEDYRPLDVECAAAALCLMRGIRKRYPSWRYLLDGDGGDENLKSYPLEDSDLTLASVLRNPLLYQEGWGVDAIKHSDTFSGGLSRSYVRTYAPARRVGFEAFSPFTVRSAIAAAVAIPFERMLAGDVQRLYSLKQHVVAAGVRQLLGIEMPVWAKRRFQHGVIADPRPPVSKAWCRGVFSRLWQERLRDTPEALDVRRSGNELPVT